ncbi:MAG: GNAT family N-acetyltransferase [Armatimonadia bacterium]
MPHVREMNWRTDRAAVLGFQAEIYETNFPGFRMNQMFLRDYEQQLRRALKHPGEYLMVLEDDDGSVCGFLWAALITTMVEPFVGYIKNIYVAPQLRGKGLGRLLLETADEWFRSNGCTKASLDASLCNTRAIDLYQASGYEPIRYRMEKKYETRNRGPMGE